MRMIDNMIDTERETLKLKGMLADNKAKPNKAQGQAAHSPLPWSADKWATGYTISATDHSVCHLQDCNNDEANARLIVASVNHAEKLAEALHLLYAGGRTPTNMDKAEAALAAWEGAQL